MTTNTVITYTTNSVFSSTTTNTVTVTGTDICQARTVAATTDCLVYVTPAPPGPVIGAGCWIVAVREPLNRE